MPGARRIAATVRPKPRACPLTAVSRSSGGEARRPLPVYNRFMSAQPSDRYAESPSSLRAALLTPSPQSPPPAAAQPELHVETTAVQDAALLPTAAELLAASPNLQRLCESYHTTRRRMVERGRRQRLGIAALVCGLGVGATVLVRQGNLPQTLALMAVVAVAVSSAVGLGVLATLWMRDSRKLRTAQGERLLRALQFNCALPEERLQAFRRSARATDSFFEVYAAWQLLHPDRRSALSIMLGAFKGKPQRTASA